MAKKIVKSEFYTKKLILAISPEQWAKFKYISKANNLTMTEQLRKLIDISISIYERNKGEIILTDDKDGK